MSCSPLDESLSLVGADLDGLHAGFRLGASLVDGARGRHDGHRAHGRLLIHDGALLCRCVLHHVSVVCAAAVVASATAAAAAISKVLIGGFLQGSAFC